MHTNVAAGAATLWLGVISCAITCGGPPADSRSVLDALIKNCKVLTSNTTKDASFYALLNFQMPSKDGPQGFNAVVVRDFEHVAVIVRSLKGEIYGFDVDGFLVFLDSTKPEGVVVAEARNPSVTFSSVDGHLKFAVDVQRSGANGSVNIDPGAILKGWNARMKELEYDAAAERLSFRTDDASVRLLVDPKPDVESSRLFMMSVRSQGVTVSLLLPEVLTPPFDPFVVSRKCVERLGLPIRELERTEQLSMMPLPSVVDAAGADSVKHKLETLFTSRFVATDKSFSPQNPRETWNKKLVELRLIFSKLQPSERQITEHELLLKNLTAEWDRLLEHMDHGISSDMTVRREWVTLRRHYIIGTREILTPEQYSQLQQQHPADSAQQQ